MPGATEDPASGPDRTSSQALSTSVFDVLSVNASVKSRASFGGTAPQEVRRQIRYWRKRLKQDAARGQRRGA